MSLAIGQVGGSLVVAALLVAFAPESLRFGFDPAKARALLRFGLPLAGANLIVFAVTSVDLIIVGHLLGATSLALYVLAFNLSSWPFNMFAPPVTNVAPAVFSRLQHDQAAMRSTFLSAVRILTAVTLPICLLHRRLRHAAYRVRVRRTVASRGPAADVARAGRRGADSPEAGV